VPGLAPPRARFAAGLSHGYHREARCRSEPAADLAGPRRRVRLRCQLRIGEAVRTDDRADARCGDPRMATAVGVSDDARALPPRLRRSGLGSEARDAPPAPASTRFTTSGPSRVSCGTTV